MANADDTNTSQNPDPDKAKDTGKESAKALEKLEAQLQAMNTRLEETMTAIAAANRKPEPRQEEVNLYEPSQMVQHVEKIFDTRLREEKNKDMVIYSLAQEYPEIQTDTKVRQAVLDAQKTVPQHLQGTAEGYELAVLKATSKAGLIPKSQRKVLDDEPSGGQRPPQPRKRVKVSPETIAAAQAMGMNTDDPEYMKRLEDAANRDSYTKYR